MPEDMLVQDMHPGDVLVHDPRFMQWRMDRDWPLNWTVDAVTFPSPEVVTIDFTSPEPGRWGGRKIRAYRRGTTLVVQRG